jgi:cob(I)alamin adenosyltransferase
MHPPRMSIVTKTGDSGTTGLMYNRRVPKNHPRIEACGAIDELNAALGVARAANKDPYVAEQLLPVQKDLVGLMGELATLHEDMPRYIKDGFARMTPDLITKLDDAAKFIESQNVSFKGWATPGENAAAAALDLARSICRRAERRAYELQEQRHVDNPSILVYLNRLSDVLWLLARRSETKI